MMYIFLIYIIFYFEHCNSLVEKMFNLNYLNFKTDTFFYDSKSYNNIHDARWCESFKLHFYCVSDVLTSGVENFSSVLFEFDFLEA